MSKAEKRAPLPIDAAAQANEQQRRESLAASQPYQRGLQHAMAQEKKNRHGELMQNLSDLKRVTLKRDTTQPARDAYDRKYRAVYALAERYATAYGEVVELPAYLPAPVPTAESVVRVGPREPTAADNSYRETKGLGPSGKGGPVPNFANDASVDAWLSVQGAK